MKIVIFTVLLILGTTHQGYCQNYLVTIHKDSTEHVPRVAQIRPRGRLVIDTLDPQRVIVSTEVLITLEKNYAELKAKIEGVQSVNDKRFEDMKWGLGTVVTIFILLIAASAFKANREARDTAKEEFEKQLSSYKNGFEQLAAEQQKQIKEFEELIQSFQK